MFELCQIELFLHSKELAALGFAMLIYCRFSGVIEYTGSSSRVQPKMQVVTQQYDLIGLDNERSEWPLFTFPETIPATMAHPKQLSKLRLAKGMVFQYSGISFLLIDWLLDCCICMLYQRLERQCILSSVPVQFVIELSVMGSLKDMSL